MDNNYIVSFYYKSDDVSIVINIRKKPNFVESILNKIHLNNFRLIATCLVDQMPGCCGIGVLTGVNVEKQWRQQGYARVIIENALELAFFKQGYSQILATTNQHTPEIHHILQSLGFKSLVEFKNSKTTNTVTLYNLKYEDYES